MSGNYKEINVAETKEWLKKYPDHSWGRAGNEYTISIPSGKGHLDIVIYTSISCHNDVARDVGKDAIRVVLFDTISNKPVNSYSRVYRTESESGPSIFDRIDERIKDAKEGASKFSFCRCGAHLVERVNRNTKQTFLGCSAYPNCGKKVVTSEIVKVTAPFESPSDLGDPMPVVNLAVKTPDKENKQIALTEPSVPFTPLLTEGELYRTDVYKYIQYPFEFFNRVQSTILHHGAVDEDCNFVLGTSTSTGKTISAELFMGKVLAEDKKVLYVSPLRSLTMEKYDDWQKTFANYSISILTGDFQLTDKRAEELKNADIICVTSEMLDSRTRNYKSERSDWLWDVGLVVIDECHILTAEERGHVVEVGILRFTKLVPQARLLLLSATMPNTPHFEQWLTTLNGKPTRCINNDWRPTTLDWHFIPHSTFGKYFEIQQEKIDLAIDLVEKKPDEKFLIFVHDKNTGRLILEELRNAKIESHFHNADLELANRKEIETSFQNKTEGIRVLVSSPTLAYGRNIPARNVVIVGTTRGMKDVDPLDIIQEGGRAGRYGIDPKGDVYLICPSPSEWKKLVTNPRPVISTLMNPNILGFHILAEIKNKEITNDETLLTWFDRTLAKLQMSIESPLLGEVIDQLIKWKMMEVRDETYHITALGNVSATLYFYPQDVNHWNIGFSIINKADLWKSNLAISYVLGTTPTMDLDYVPRNDQERVSHFVQSTQRVFREKDTTVAVRSSVIATDLHDWLSQTRNSPRIRSITVDADRICQALKWIGNLKGWDSNAITGIALRLKYGVPLELVNLCELPGIGAARARKLFAEGITNTTEILQNQSKVQTLLGPAITRMVVMSIQESQNT